MSKQVIGTGALANDGTGDALRTVFTKCNSNFTELYARGFVSVKDFGAAVDGSTDDTAAVQSTFDTKKRVLIASGVTKLTDLLSLSTIGQIIAGTGISNGTNGSLLQQTVSGKGGLDFTTTLDTLPVGGGGIYYSSVRDLSLRTTNVNTGVGINLGNDATHSGDYTALANLHLMGWQTHLHLKSMAMTRLSNVTVAGDASTPSDYGVRMEGGSDNSNLLMGLSAAHCTIGLSCEGLQFGNVYMLGDFGANGTHVSLSAAGSGGTFIGGNFETYSTRGFDIASNANATVMGVFFNNPTSAIPPYNCNDGGRLLRINCSSSLSVGTMEVTGAGYGTTMSLSTNLDIDTQDGTGTYKWKDLPFPSVLRAALTARLFLDGSQYGAIAHVIRDSSGYGGLVRAGKDSGGTGFYDWLCDDTPNVADGDYVVGAKTLTIQNGKIKAIV